MKLLYAPQSPFARKVRVAAIELGLGDIITLEYVEVLPVKSSANFENDYNPLKKIPALVRDDGSVLFDSTVICEFLDETAGGGNLIPKDLDQRFQILTNHALAQGLCESIVSLRYETWLRPEVLRWPEWINAQWATMDRGLGWFEQNACSLGRPIDIAQITLGCLLGYLDFRWPENGWRKRFSNVSTWYKDISKLSSFAATVPSAPPQA